MVGSLVPKRPLDDEFSYRLLRDKQPYLLGVEDRAGPPYQSRQRSKSLRPEVVELLPLRVSRYYTERK